MKRAPVILTAFTLMAVLSTALTAQVSEDDLDAMLAGEGGEIEAAPVNQKKWEFFGFFENENYFGVAGNDRSREIIKNEGRVNLKARYGGPLYYLKGNFDAYFYPESRPGGADSYGNVHERGSVTTVEARELYLAGGERFQFKIGKIVHNWGTADAFTVVNYLDRADLREFFMKDDGDETTGVYALNLKYLFGDFMVETSFVPLHNPPLFPDAQGVWAIKPAAVDTAFGAVTPEIDYGGPLATNWDNASAALRAGGTLGTLDFHLSYFYGPDQSIFFIPAYELSHGGNPASPTGINSVTLSPYYESVHKAGFDMAYVYEKLSVRAEAAFTYDKPAIVSDTAENVTTVVTASTVTQRALIEKEHYGAYTVGADYNLWGENGLVLLEYTQARYFKNNDRYQAEFLNDFVVIRIEDKFFDRRLSVELGAIVRPVQNEAGYIPVVEAGWDFQNGLSVEAGAVIFEANNDELLALYENLDLVSLSARYTF